ncbi:MAG: FkbM family methyltransferase [Candidatus Levyibacteriota bacterium]
MLKKSNFINLRNYFLVRIRGVFCYALYIYRFYPGLNRAKKINKNPIVDIKIDKINYKMMLDLNDEGIAIDLFIGRLREYPNVLYFKKFLKEYRQKINTIVEIGANIGYYVCYENAILKQALKKKMHIYAVEPVSRNMALLKENIKLNNVSNITLIHAAIGEKNKKINLIVPPQGNYTQIEGVTGNERYSSNFVKERIDMYSLKTLFAKYKIPQKNLLFRWDIEGYEYNLVKGNYDMFKKLQNVHIIMEFHAMFLKEKKIVEFLNMFKKLGFKLRFAVSCYPPYFIRMPSIVKWILIKTFLIQHHGTNLGLLPEFKSLDDLIMGFKDPDNALYDYTNLHFYLAKN